MMPDKVKELDNIWQEQADRYTELAGKTLFKKTPTKP